MSKRQRKPLDDALASDFVYGEKASEEQLPDREEPEVEPASATVKKNKESSLMDKLQVQPKEGTKRFTIDLRESVHRKLSILAAKTGRSKADIIRMVLDDVLEDVEE